MKFGALWAAILSGAALVAQPCLAAQDLTASGYVERRSGGFAGAQLKLELGRSARTVPTARLQVGMTHRYQGVGMSLPSRSFNVSALELGLTGGRQPLLLIGGQDTSSIKRRLGVNGSATTTLLVVGGLALAGLAVLLITSDNNECPIPEGGC